MLNSKLRNKIEQIIKEAFKDVSLWDLDDDDEEYIDSELAKNCNYPYNVFHGASKMCVILAPLTDCGYVVKFPLQYTMADSDSCSSYYGSRTPLENASKFWRSSNLLMKIANERGYTRENEIDDTTIYDYCRTEARITEMIEGTYVEQFFAKTYWICDLNGIPVYVQEYMPGSNWVYVSEETKKRYNSSHIVASRELGSSLAMCFMSNRTDEELKYFQNFMTFFDNMGIQDIHSENIRCSKDDKLYIIDYSGFDW